MSKNPKRKEIWKNFFIFEIKFVLLGNIRKYSYICISPKSKML